MLSGAISSAIANPTDVLKVSAVWLASPPHKVSTATPYTAGSHAKWNKWDRDCQTELYKVIQADPLRGRCEGALQSKCIVY